MGEITREHFTTSRSLEFFTQKELSMQLGESDQELWALAITKELIDNSLDAAEMAGVLPVVEVDTDFETYFSVADNGPGLPADVIKKSLDYTVRISDKNLYISPSRGQLGNALKCTWAFPFVADSGWAVVYTGGRRFEIKIGVDRIAQAPKIQITETEGHVKNGTKIILRTETASYLKSVYVGNSYRWSQRASLAGLLETYAFCNPHAEFRFNEELVHGRTADQIGKWTSGQAMSCHWFNAKELSGLVAGYLANDRDILVRELLALFKGLAGTGKQKKILDATGLNGARVSALVEDGAVSEKRVDALLSAMREKANPVKAGALGKIGDQHIKNCMEALSCEGIEYRTKALDVENIPYVLEVCFGIMPKDAQFLSLCALNWSAAIRKPTGAISDALAKASVAYDDHVALFIHIASPKLQFSDRGKSLLSLPGAVEKELKSMIINSCKAWTKMKRQADRAGRVRDRQIEEMRRNEKRQYMTAKAAAYRVMEAAYLKASGNDKYPANARQIMYAARPDVIRMTGKEKPWKNSSYFTQVLLVGFIEEHPELTAGWDVVFDARGNFAEPHTDKVVPLGTLEVRRYIQSWTYGKNFPSLEIDFPNMITTSGPECRYRNALFIEKEGFNELLRAGEFAQRYDMAIMSTKGMTVTASRTLVDSLSRKGIKIFIVRDFDKAGFSIVHTLKSNTYRYQYEVLPEVIDLGLRLEDVEEMGLDSEEVSYDSKINPKINLRESGASDEEQDFLVSGGYSENWTGQRVELNAMTSDQFIEWLDQKLIDHGAEKVIPDDEDIEKWFKRACRQAYIESQVEHIIDQAKDLDVEIPEDLVEQVKAKIDKNKLMPWDRAVYSMAQDAMATE
jgi:DNA topoisomerase VI subunit B